MRARANLKNREDPYVEYAAYRVQADAATRCIRTDFNALHPGDIP